MLIEKELGPDDSETVDLIALYNAVLADNKKLKGALQFYADEKNWYPVNGDTKTMMVIASIDTEGHNWVGGRRARIALVASEGEKET